MEAMTDIKKQMHSRAHEAVGGLCCFGIICAAIAVGGWAGVAVCDWLIPFSVGSQVGVARTLDADRAHLPTIAEASCAQPPKAARSVRGTGWIADVWSGPRRTGAFRVSGVSADGKIETQCVEAGRARRGFGETIRRALRKRGKAPLEERYARRADDPFDTPEARRRSHGSGGEDENRGPTIYEGDVYISGLPMVDQGNRAYCAVASAARVLQGYGIEVTMDDLAEMAHSSETGGTNPRLWENAIRKVANTHGLELKVVSELTETSQSLANLVYDYNQTARDMGYEELYSWDYVNAFVHNYAAFQEDRSYDVQREVMLSSDRKADAFDKNVTERIDESDPLFWTVRLGDVPEEVPHGNDTYLSADHASHMRLIIGYNEERGEVLYSDSWGEGHELKRMDAADALSITTAMSYLTE